MICSFKNGLLEMLSHRKSLFLRNWYFGNSTFSHTPKLLINTIKAVRIKKIVFQIISGHLFI